MRKLSRVEGRGRERGEVGAAKLEWMKLKSGKWDGGKGERIRVKWMEGRESED